MAIFFSTLMLSSLLTFYIFPRSLTFSVESVKTKTFVLQPTPIPSLDLQMTITFLVNSTYLFDIPVTGSTVFLTYREFNVSTLRQLPGTVFTANKLSSTLFDMLLTTTVLGIDRALMINAMLIEVAVNGSVPITFQVVADLSYLGIPFHMETTYIQKIVPVNMSVLINTSIVIPCCHRNKKEDLQI